MSTDQAAVTDQLAGLGARRTRGRRPARVLVIGNFGNGNTGDEALLARALQELPPGTEVSVLSRNPRVVEWLHGVDARPMAALSFARGLRWSDAVVVVGGGMFGAGLPPMVRLLPRVVDAAEAAGRDTAYLAIGAYPGMPSAVLRRLRAAKGRITVRDGLSVETLGGGVPNIGDLALGLRPESHEAAERALAGAGVDRSAPLLLLSLKALPDLARMTALQDACQLAAQRWRESGGVVAALALSTHADYGLGLARRDAVLAAELAERLGEPIPVVGPQLPPALAKAVVGQAAGVLGLRLHALIFAVGGGVPCAGFTWEEKTQAFLASADNATALDHPSAVAGWVERSLAAVAAR
ncbi:polysaccharide pyruvyl transferase family protein [Amycolatopsis sp. H20-H5]|uniref:polysaccharide pyruvyl transferase family protein n=1 Tax=Amycolatopsis sp. H20-H5 TaxID=3046309 RepID=UPI002DB7368F|nr:polysaccharide pyruvyl transferase family protein [Amycolatopsis sp. H20-H5]MEC3982067.1 polysaccharide pyruvyl transferase family protein [Amycolatopsis sp. H20-H5]